MRPTLTLPNPRLSGLHDRCFDVVVCGAGSAGIAAAAGAAQTGARTLLIERYGFPGGSNTAAMVHSLDAMKNCRDCRRFVVAGVAAELIAELDRLGGLATEDNPPETMAVHPEYFKIASDRLLARAGVCCLYHALVIGALVEDGRLVGVEVALRDGRALVRAKAFVDCTGDADVAFLAGAPYRLDGELQALTLWFRVGNVAPGRNWRQLEEDCRRALDAAFREGEVGLFGGPWVIRVAAGEVTLNCVRVRGNPVDPLELSRAEGEAREQMLVVFRALRKRVPDFRSSYLLAAAPQLHVRESRKIVGEYVLEESDVVNGARFPDAIAVGAWPVDIHPTDGFVGVHPHKENPPEPYEIPYRCLVPLAVDGLLVAGRPISTTHRAHGSTRVQGTSMATGHAAGVAAALSAGSGAALRRLDPVLLRSTLIEQGAIVSRDCQLDAEPGLAHPFAALRR